MLAVVHCLETWRVYLLRTKFVVRTDNVANTYFSTQKKLSPKQARWQERLSEYDFEWQHKPGKSNQVADALSRKQITALVAALTRLETDFVGRVRELAKEDLTYQNLLLQVADGSVRRYWEDQGLLYAKGNRLLVPNAGRVRAEILRECHDTEWAGHPGVERMMALLARSYYWPRMEDDVELYVKTCLTCQQDKTEKKKAAGLLKPLPIAEKPWVSISMDFIGGMPMVNNMSSVFVVVDRFSKYGVFIPAPKECKAEVAAELFYQHVVKNFGLPEDIVSDRDARFTGRFWTTLFGMMGTELKFSTANHPQTDGQTERVNALLEEYLRHYVTASQKNWVDLLASAQLSYNMHKSSSTGRSPFELVLGYQPLTPHEVIQASKDSRCPAATRFVRDKKEMLDEARDSLEKAGRRMVKNANRGRRAEEFEVGDQVLLKLTPQLWKKVSSKTVHRGLIPRYDGPFLVVKRVGSVAYRLQLPERLKVHPTFHVSFLKRYHADADPQRKQRQRAPPTIRAQFEREVEAVLDRRVEGASKRNRRIYFLVKWKDWPESENSWERDTDLWQFEDKVADYLNTSMRASSSSGGGGLLHPK